MSRFTDYKQINTTHGFELLWYRATDRIRKDVDVHLKMTILMMS